MVCILCSCPGVGGDSGTEAGGSAIRMPVRWVCTSKDSAGSCTNGGDKAGRSTGRASSSEPLEGLCRTTEGLPQSLRRRGQRGPDRVWKGSFWLVCSLQAGSSRTEAGRTGRGLCRLQERGDNSYGQGGGAADGENRVGSGRILKAETTDVCGALGPVSTRRTTAPTEPLCTHSLFNSILRHTDPRATDATRRPL